MKKLLLACILAAAPSCAWMDKTLGVDDSPEESEARIESLEGTVRDVGNVILYGAGTGLAAVLGFGARAYVKRRKAKATA